MERTDGKMRISIIKNWNTLSKKIIPMQTFYLLPSIEFTSFSDFFVEEEDDEFLDISFSWLIFYFCIKFYKGIK